MSERWGICKNCNGIGEVYSETKEGWIECQFCLGTAGYSGHAFEMHVRNLPMDNLFSVQSNKEVKVK